MSLTEDELRRLQTILALAEDNEERLRPREREFIADQQKRLEEHGGNMRLSPAQWKWLIDIEERFTS